MNRALLSLALGCMLPLLSACPTDSDSDSESCGNGTVEGSEVCDDGNANEDDDCTSLCQAPSCGDGLLSPSAGEECDDGNGIDDDLCTTLCRNPVCGDGIASSSAGEECDDGNAVDTDACTNACRLPVCGDQILTTSSAEECDDGNDDNTDGCKNDCTLPVCGDGVTTPSLNEACDDGNDNDDDECTSLCQPPTCGDEIVSSTNGEQCDDGNDEDLDLCRNNCMVPICSDGVVTSTVGEVCDDGNLVNDDGCDVNCTPSGCGNGIVNVGEGCDDGNTSAEDGCNATCQPEFVCGNGVLELGEECDDGNLLSRDGCSALCQTESCGNGAVDAGEQCDDGNLIDGDGCSSSCQEESVASTDLTSAGLGGLRTIGTGTITLGGIGTGTVTRALLYWHGPTRVASTEANANIRLNGIPITGTNIGFAADNCWGFNNSQAYRADVTSLVRGDGTYTVNDLLGPGVDINGVSLIVFFDDGDPTNDNRVFLFDGNDSNIDSPFEPADWQQEWGGIMVAENATVALELHVSDGQNFDDAPALLNGQPVVPANAFQGQSVPSAGSDLNGGLWDIIVVPSVSALIPSGTSTVTLTQSVDPAAQFDCLSLIVGVVLVDE